MSDFLTTEWEKLCEQTRLSAKYYSERSSDLEPRAKKDCEQFCSQEMPGSYSEFLKRTADARDIAVNWMNSITSFSDAGT
jgi:hypothetical protein